MKGREDSHLILMLNLPTKEKNTNNALKNQCNLRIDTHNEKYEN